MAASMPPHGPAPGRGTTLPALLLLIGKPSICSRRQDGRYEKDLQPSMPSAFLSATDNNRWCLRVCRCGTLSGMDAVPEPTRTYLRRVPHRHACKRPQQTEAFAWSSGCRAQDWSVGSAAPHPVSGHAVNPSLEARWRHPCRHTVPPPDAAPRAQRCHC
ncbi:hypothetical protein XacyCFBP1159_04095 [Xanthomonas arboricola pv. corylina]|nr:hypothetical protein XacyCFBP1159_04095 [Xanthomonas arboricola pv. corylina]